jgi:hypothetical protein
MALTVVTLLLIVTTTLACNHRVFHPNCRNWFYHSPSEFDPSEFAPPRTPRPVTLAQPITSPSPPQRLSCPAPCVKHQHDELRRKRFILDANEFAKIPFETLLAYYLLCFHHQNISNLDSNGHLNTTITSVIYDGNIPKRICVTPGLGKSIFDLGAFFPEVLS